MIPNIRIDIVMWTLNSERTLARCLKSIDEAIPSKLVNQKIMVDGHSQDRTRKIGETFGWEVFDAEKVGIPYQANQALSHVKTPIFASFEHDIILNPCWFKYVFPRILEKGVAVVQGVRVSTLPVAREIDLYTVERAKKNRKRLQSLTSIDNNLFKTDIVRAIDGFPIESILSTDVLLRGKIEAEGYKWIIDPTVVSGHLKSSINDHLTHIYRLSKQSRKSNLRKDFFLLLYSPISSLKMAFKMKCPQIFFFHLRYRYAKLKGTLDKT